MVLKWRTDSKVTEEVAVAVAAEVVVAIHSVVVAMGVVDHHLPKLGLLLDNLRGHHSSSQLQDGDSNVHHHSRNSSSSNSNALCSNNSNSSNVQLSSKPQCSRHHRKPVLVELHLVQQQEHALKEAPPAKRQVVAEALVINVRCRKSSVRDR